MARSHRYAEPADVGQAAPPDDGGTTGSFTRPDETLEVGSVPDGGPPLHRDQASDRGPHAPLAMVVACLVAVAIVALVVLFYAPR